MTSLTTQTAPAAAQAEEALFAAADKRATLDRGDFMKLFLTQLQYQDPSNPMESAEMSSQLAQFNMVDLMYKNNEAMEKLATSDEARTRLQAVSFLRQDVRYAGSILPVGPDGAKPFDLELDKPAASCVVTIRDSEGRVVRSWDLGALSTGVHPLPWDGTDESGVPVPEGDYRVGVEAKDEQGEEVQVGTWTTGSVSGVTYPETGLPELRINGGEIEVGLDEIRVVGA